MRCLIRDYYLFPQHPKGKLVDKPEFLQFLYDHQLLETCNRDQNDDAVLVRFAFDTRAVIVSNDQFRDQSTYGDPELSKFIKDARLAFKFVFGQFTPIWGSNARIPGAHSQY